MSATAFPVVGIGASGVMSLTAGTGITLTPSTITATGSIALTNQAFVSVNIQSFTSSGTYTPTSGMLYCIVEAWGAGGGCGGTANTSSSQVCVSGAGGGGEYIRTTFSAATVGASQTVTIGSGGTAGTAGDNAGGNGGNTTLGSLLTAHGGSGGAGGAAITNTSNYTYVSGASGGSGGSGDLVISGIPGETSYGTSASTVFNAVGGAGGNAPFLQGRAYSLSLCGVPSVALQGVTPFANSGAGASANVVLTSVGAIAGTAGADGFMIVTEYIV